MSIHRCLTVVALGEGGALIPDGDDYEGRPGNAEIYEPATRTFTETVDWPSPRCDATTLMLPNGTAMLAGGYMVDGYGMPWYQNMVDIYDPASHTFRRVGAMAQWRISAELTLLADGRVLATGGSDDIGSRLLSSAEVYDPATESWTLSGGMNISRASHVTAVLTDGRVLIAGGQTCVDEYGNCQRTRTAEIYDPATGQSTLTGSLPADAANETLLSATTLGTGQVLVAGRRMAWMYNPATGTFSSAGSYAADANRSAVVPLPGDRVLAFGGGVSADVGTLSAPDVVSGTLVLPQDWTTQTAIPVQISAAMMYGTVEAVGLSGNADKPLTWVPASNGDHIETTYTPPQQGLNQPVTLWVRDSYGRTAAVVQGTIDNDSTLPSSRMRPLPSRSVSPLTLSWSGNDAVSGIAGYDVEIRAGVEGVWTPLVTATTALSTTFSGDSGTVYFFRVRATDQAGNIEAWPETYDATTTVDGDAPTGTLAINSGALATTSPAVTLRLSVVDAVSSVSHMRFSANGTTWGNWQPYKSSSPAILSGSNGLKAMFAQVRDTVGNVSAVLSDTIRLDTAVGSGRVVSIDDGALWTNTVSVTLTVGAPAGTTLMQLSNDGGFAGATWQPFDTRPAWTVVPYGSYTIPRTVYVRTRDAAGVISTGYTDDIIYDPQPPQGSVDIASVQATTVQAQLAASDPDNLSGVARMRVSLRSDFSGVSWEAYRTAKTLPRNGVPEASLRVYAQFEDGAGNRSAVSCAQANGLVCNATPTATPTQTRTPTRTPIPTRTATTRPSVTPSRTTAPTSGPSATPTRTVITQPSATPSRTTGPTTQPTATATRTALPTRTIPPTRTPGITPTIPAPGGTKVYLPFVQR